MYSRSIQGHHVCLLVKKVSSQYLLLCSLLLSTEAGFPLLMPPCPGLPSKIPIPKMQPISQLYQAQPILGQSLQLPQALQVHLG